MKEIKVGDNVVFVDGLYYDGNNSWLLHGIAGEIVEPLNEGDEKLIGIRFEKGQSLVPESQVSHTLTELGKKMKIPKELI